MSKRIVELTEGETFSECRFQVHNARVQQAATGPCIVLKLSDETGTRWARRWKATEAEQQHVLNASFVFVSGRVRSGSQFAGDLEITAFECLQRAPGTASALPEAVFESFLHDSAVSHRVRRMENIARSIFGAECGSFARLERFETELRRTLEQMYTLGKNAPRSRPARPSLAPPHYYECADDEVNYDPFADD